MSEEIVAEDMMMEEDKAATAKIGVYRQWQFALHDIQWKMEEIEYNLERQRYERDVLQRLYDATQDDRERKHWQKLIAGINKALSVTEAKQAKLAQKAAYCEAALALIRGDLEAEGIDPDTWEEDFFGDEFDDEFEDEEDFGDFDEDEIPF
ncbi:MAG TPA: hypothetical protein PLJ78_11790 [Anaerolineae bacterium]|nr:hypothetical protein [Anaerolineae bacterium]HQK14610.1 hypothetical protein [Anaerolineae bacterium]